MGEITKEFTKGNQMLREISLASVFDAMVEALGGVTKPFSSVIEGIDIKVEDVIREVKNESV